MKAAKRMLTVNAHLLLSLLAAVMCDRAWAENSTPSAYDVYNQLDSKGGYHNPGFSLEAALLPHINHYFARHNASHALVRLISLGCSLGHGVESFASSGYDTYGVDVSAASISQALQLGRGQSCRSEGIAPPPCLQQASLTALPFGNSWFRAGVSADVLEHLQPEDVEAAVAEISRVVSSELFLRISTVAETRKMTLDGVELKLHLTVKPEDWWRKKFTRHGWHNAHLPGYPSSNDKTAFLMLRRSQPRPSAKASANA